MSIPCPYCKSPLNPKGLKPGQFKPKCPKCTKQFLLVVPNDPDGTILAQMLPEDLPAPEPPGGDPGRTGDFTEPLRSPDATGEFTEPAKSPDATGEFTEPAHSPDATGDFT